MAIEIIAEIGVNHDGDIDKAFKLVDAAVEAGCNTVKVQVWDSAEVYEGESIEYMRQFELTSAQIINLKYRCERLGIGFLATPDTLRDAQFLKDIGCTRIKIGSQSLRDLDFLEAVGELGIPLIMSSGAIDHLERMRAVRACRPRVVLHCVSSYPAPLCEMNLRCLNSISGVEKGLSDHTMGNLAAIAALTLGATVFEKHLTLSNYDAGPDHAMSLEPADMKTYVTMLRSMEVALGDGNKRVMPSEALVREKQDRLLAKKKVAA